ncbi:MAG: DNA-binding response regulator [Bacteroidetes bacterium]|nr:MAG: DNA-binding response regulator [Bacteroidota bacterium]
MCCLIVDDEHLARSLLAAYVAKLPQLKLVDSCENAMQALAVLQTQPVDVLLLDIQMPDLSGLELVQVLNPRPLVILTTAYAEYALKGFELEVMDYLLKPIAFERFVQAINKAAAQLKLRREAAATVASPADYFYAKVDYKWVKVRYEDVLYIEGLKEYVSIFTPQRRLVVYQALKKLEHSLPPGKFIRVHKSYIVALDKITAVYGNTIEIGQKEIPIGKSYKANFFKKIETL